MLGVVIGLFVVLHGLVHLWFVVVSQRLVTFQPGMRVPGWSGTSWILSSLVGDAPARTLASILFAAAAAAFVVSGAGILARQEWVRPVLMWSAVLSAAVILLFWDGRPDQLVDKGVIGLLVDAAILAALMFIARPVAAY